MLEQLFDEQPQESEQFEQPLQPQEQPLFAEDKIPLVPLENSRTKSISHQLLLQELLPKNKMIKHKIKAELSKVFEQEQSFVKQLLHSIKRTSF